MTGEPTKLAEKLKRQIAQDGPITVEAYMAACLGDPEHGYYRTRDPLGAAGDFTTAPEISQAFGELIGAWCAEMWNVMGAPRPLRLIELGPGRGTLMSDALRTLRLLPSLVDALEIDFIETSRPLRAQQEKHCVAAPCPFNWYDRIEDVPLGATLLIANEFFDALPVRQLVRHADGWNERLVTYEPEHGFAFTLSQAPIEDLSLVPPECRDATAGSVVELRPACENITGAIAARAENHPLAALIIDYGHAESAPGDTLQAVCKHRYSEPLHAPGDADLTAHVDFASLRRASERHGLNCYGPITQARLLFKLGLTARIERLAASAGPEQAQAIATSAHRLVDPARMGELFKAFAMTSTGLPPPQQFGTEF